MAPDGEKMRKHDKSEKRAPDQSKRREYSKIPKEVALGENQAHEGAYCRQAAEADRSGLVLQHFFGIFHVFVVREHVQAVAERHSKHYGAYPQRHY